MTNLKVGDIVSWDSDSWEVIKCGFEKEVLANSEGGWLTDIENQTRGKYTVREADVTVTEWAPNTTVRKGSESRPS